MTKRTWWFTFVTTLLISGLAACGGSGGGGGGGGGIPGASNSAITPPPTTAVAITATPGTTSQTNQSIASNALQASDVASSTASTAGGLPGLTGVQADSGTQAKHDTLAAIVRRHAERLKDHKSSVTGVLQVATQPCSGGGTLTVAFDDASNSATEVFVNCNLGGIVTHGTLSSSNVSVVPELGSTVGSPYKITVMASFNIDLSFTTTAPPASTFVTQSSFTFTATFFGNMQADGTGGVEPGFPNRVQISMSGASLLASDGTIRELLSNFNIIVDNNDALENTTISGGYTYASTVINGSVTVNIPPLAKAVVFQPQGALHPSSGEVTITSLGSPGKIVLTVISTPVVGVRVDAYADANGSVTETANLTWDQVDAL
jgi:hypothetical protein